MKKSKIFLASLTLLALFLVFGSVNAATFNNETSNNTNIQNFLSNTSTTDNEVILVGTFNNTLKNLIISRNVTIKGDNNTKIIGDNKSTLFTIKAGYVIITGITILEYDTAIYNNGTNTKIYNNTISNNGNQGIYNLGNGVIIEDNIFNNNLVHSVYNHASNIKIINNKFYGNYYGIYSANGSNLNISNNEINFSSIYGIHITKGSDSFIINNIVNKCQYGIQLFNYNNTLITNNTANNNNWYGIQTDATSYNIMIINNTANYNNKNSGALGSSGIHSYGPNAIIANNTLYHNNKGIHSGENNSLISENDIYNTTYNGIHVDNRGHNSKVENNTVIISGNSGIFTACNNVTIINNIIKHSEIYGIHGFEGISNIKILNNNILNSSYGIYFKNGKNYTIHENSVSNSTTTGIYAYIVDYVDISRNIIINDKYGSYNGNGIVSYDTNNTNITNNEISLSHYGISNSLYSRNYGTNYNISDNMIMNSTYGIYNTVDNAVINNNNINGSSTYGIRNTAISNFTVYNNKISNGNDAIWISTDINNGTYENNTITNNNRGFYISNNTNAIIKNNIIFSNVMGIFIDYNNVNIPLYATNNNITNNNYLLVINGDNNNLTGEIIKDNLNGILVNGINNIIKNNEIYSNSATGLIFNETSKNNTFINGTIKNNGFGVIMMGTRDSVFSSTIISNVGNGFNVSGFKNIVNYNRIYKNALGMYNNGDDTNANLNWWGVNNATTQFVSTANNLNLNIWYVLLLSANKFNTTTNASKNFIIGEIINLTYQLATNNYSINDPSLLPYFEVNILTSLGHNISGDIRYASLSVFVSSNDTSLFESGLENFIFNNIKALSDDEDVKLDLFLEMKVDPNPEPVNPVDPEYNDGSIDHIDTDDEMNNETNNDSKVNALMKKTGILMNLILLVLLSGLTVIFGKKQN